MNTVFLTPEQVVQKQLDAYNVRDVDMLLTIYAEDAEINDSDYTGLATHLGTIISMRFK